MGRRLLVVGLVLALTTVSGSGVFAQTVDDDLEPSRGEQRHIVALLVQTDLTEAEIVALRADGAGWGEIRKAYRLSEAEGISMEAALEQIRTDDDEADDDAGPPPWAKKHRAFDLDRPPGQLLQAARIAHSTDLSVASVLALKVEGVGWGQIRKAAQLADTDGLTVEQALEQVTSSPDE